MMNRFKWIAKEFQWLGIRILHVFAGRYYVNKKSFAGVGLHTCSEGNDYIYEGLMGNEPFAVGRCSFSENGYVCCAQNEIWFHSKVHYFWTPSYINGIEVMNRDKGIKAYHKLMLDSLQTVDAIGCWTNMVMCDAILELVPNISEKYVFNADAVSPFDVKTTKSWTKALAGKTVLVVSPFYKEIEEQYAKRDFIWDKGQMPECKLIFDKSVWLSEEENAPSYYELLDVLTERILVREFDIALLGCGPFGLPLAAAIKKSGRKAVHMASGVQLLFGIKGKRWDNAGIYNEYWIRPGESTKPKDVSKLDGGAYW